MTVNNKQLKDFIADSGLVPRTELDEVAKRAEEKKTYLGDMLVSEGKLSDDDLRRTEAYILGIPFVNLKTQKVEFDVLSLIPEPIARKHNIIAFKKTPTALEVAMLDTDDLTAIDFVKKKVGLKRNALAISKEPKGRVRRYY